MKHMHPIGMWFGTVLKMVHRKREMDKWSISFVTVAKYNAFHMKDKISHQVAHEFPIIWRDKMEVNKQRGNTMIL